MITSDLLVRATRCTPERAAVMAIWMDAAARRWGINTPERIAAWLAQTAYESGRYEMLQESLYYTNPARMMTVWPSRFRLPVTEREESLDIFHDGKRNPRKYLRKPEALANFVYAKRMGNGDEASGDGWRYIGRGVIQLTGRDNYTRYAADSRHPAMGSPEIVAEPMCAADSAGWFWHINDCNRFADSRDWLGLTRKVNGGTHGLHQRRDMALAALTALDVA